MDAIFHVAHRDLFSNLDVRADVRAIQLPTVCRQKEAEAHHDDEEAMQINPGEYICTVYHHSCHNSQRELLGPDTPLWSQRPRKVTWTRTLMLSCNHVG